MTALSSCTSEVTLGSDVGRQVKLGSSRTVAGNGCRLRIVSLTGAACASEENVAHVEVSQSVQTTCSRDLPGVHGTYRSGSDQSEAGTLRRFRRSANPRATPTPMATVRSATTVRTIVSASRNMSDFRSDR